MTRYILLILLPLAIYSCGENVRKVETIYYNGHIHTIDSAFTITTCMAVDSGKVIATGSMQDLKRKYLAARWVDLKGAFVYPGFIDPHCHFFSYGWGLQHANLVGTSSPEEIVERLRGHLKAYPSDWVLGRGWDQNDWKIKKFPHKAILDKAFPGKAVYLSRIDGHAAFVNSVTLKLAGITGKTSIKGGHILLDSKGEPTGVLIDNAMSLVDPYLPKGDPESYEKALMNAQKNCFAAGLTTVSDAGIDHSLISQMNQLQEAGKLKIKIYAMLNPGKENFEAYLYKGVFHTGRLHVCSIKLFADGALGSRGALLLESYSDDPGNRGLLINSPEYYSSVCKEALDHGYQVNTHCIGDSANRMILHIYARILGGKNDKRWRIEHAQVIQPDDFNLFAEYSIIPSVQTTHATSDMYWAGERLGKERLKNAYAYKTLLNQNGWLPNGSDFPVEQINPVYGFYAAVVRKDLDGKPDGGFQMENALTREEALKAMTIWAARACFEENEKGSLEPGKYADFVLTDRDLMEVDELEIPRTMILATYVNGEKVFELKE